MSINLGEIAKGWFNYATADFHTQQLAQYRLNICDECPNKQQLSTIGKLLVTAINEEGSLFKCDLCSCPLSAKVCNPLSKCPRDKWGVAGMESMY
jgi:hypothetical protein